MEEQILPYPFKSTANSQTEFIPVSLFNELESIPVAEPISTVKDSINTNNSSKEKVETKKSIANTVNQTPKEKTILPYSQTEALSTHQLNTYVNLTENIQDFKSIQTQTVTEQETDQAFVIEYKKLNDTTNNWMFWIILCSLVLLGWSRLLYRKQFGLISRSALNFSFAQKTFKNSSEFSDGFSSILNLIFILNLGLFAYQTTVFYTGINLLGIQSAGITLAIGVGITILYAIKNLILSIFGYIFENSSYTQEYMQNVYLYNKLFGLFLFPIVIAIAFVKQGVIGHDSLILLGIILFVLFFILRIIRGIRISIRSNVSILYMFLYFCTLEVLPILLMIKTGAILSKLFYL